MAASKLKSMITIALMIALPIAYLIAVVRHQTRLAPGNGVKTYSQLKAQGVPLKRATRVSNPANHVCVFGDATAGLWTLSSGPPAYLSDESGQIVDFTSDVGDSTRFQKHYGVYSGIEVDIRTLDDQFVKVDFARSADNTGVRHESKTDEQSELG